MKLGELKYKDMMKNPDIVCPKEVSDLYDELNKKYRYMVNMKDEYIDNLHYVACSIRNQFAELGYSEEMIADMLVQYLYGNEKRGKQLFWFCYGQYVVTNLENNPNIKKKKTKMIQCIDCGEWIEVDQNNVKTCRCKRCTYLHRNEYQREIMRKRKNLA